MIKVIFKLKNKKALRFGQYTDLIAEQEYQNQKAMEGINVFSGTMVVKSIEYGNEEFRVIEHSEVEVNGYKNAFLVYVEKI